MEKVINLIDKTNFTELLSICIGKVYSNQIELQSYLGQYQRWNVQINNGKLNIDEQEFDVDFLGTTSVSDGMWFNADLEKEIPLEYLQYINCAYENMQKYGIQELLSKKIKLDNIYTDHSLAIVYTALAEKKTCYFKGSGDVSIFMIFKSLPESIFTPINSNKFLNRTLDIISNFNVNARLMIKAFAISNDNKFEETEDTIIVKFENEGNLIFKFDDKNRLINASGEIQGNKLQEETQKLKITEIWMKKGQELLEHFASEEYRKTFEELNEDEKEKLKNKRVKAICSIALNDYVKIEDIFLIQGNNGLFIGMPFKKLPDRNYKDIIHPTTMEYGNYIKEKLIDLYNSDLNYYCDMENVNKPEITDIKIRLINSETNDKADCTVVMENSFVFHDIKIKQTENGLLVVKLCKKNEEGYYEEIFKIRKNENEELNELIIGEYNKQLKLIKQDCVQNNEASAEKNATSSNCKKAITELELSEQDKIRIEKNINILKEKEIPYMEKMVNIPIEKNIKIESKENIYTKLLFDYASASIASTILNRNGNHEGVYDMVMENLQKKHQILNWLSEDLKKSLLQYKHETYNPDSLNATTWRYEECAVSMWALGLIDKPENNSQCDVNKMNNILYYIEDCDNFINKCILKDKEEILEYADMLYRLNWACEEVRLQGKKLNNVNGAIVYYQKKAIDLIMFLD